MCQVSKKKGRLRDVHGQKGTVRKPCRGETSTRWEEMKLVDITAFCLAKSSLIAQPHFLQSHGVLSESRKIWYAGKLDFKHNSSKRSGLGGQRDCPSLGARAWEGMIWRVVWSRRVVRGQPERSTAHPCSHTNDLGKSSDYCSVCNFWSLIM
jgi:hypothetical protein